MLGWTRALGQLSRFREKLAEEIHSAIRICPDVQDESHVAIIGMRPSIPRRVDFLLQWAGVVAKDQSIGCSAVFTILWQ